MPAKYSLLIYMRANAIMPASSKSLFARQAIFDSSHQVHGYELLFRSENTQSAIFECGEKATAQVLSNLCTGTLLENAKDDTLFFINFDESFIISEAFFPAPPQNVVLEILETVTPTDKVIRSLQKLKHAGYQLALDDYTFKPEADALLPLVSHIKVDVLSTNMNTLEADVKKLGDHFTLLAEKVEDESMFQYCQALGFTLFQGYHLEYPKMVSGFTLNHQTTSALNLVSELSQHTLTTNQITESISKDPGLTFKILKLVNCPLYPFKTEVVTIKEALIKLGIETIRQWAIVMTIADNSDAPIELLRQLLVRAKACELTAFALKQEKAPQYFVIGLLSGIDALLKIPLIDIVECMHLSSDIKHELFPDAPEQLLNHIKRYERGNFSSIDSYSPELLRALQTAYLKAIIWADDALPLIR